MQVNLSTVVGIFLFFGYLNLSTDIELPTKRKLNNLIEMLKDEDGVAVSAPTLHSASSTTTTTAGASLLPKKEASIGSSLFGRGRYKFWALAAILLLAFWSMLTGTVTLRWSAGNLSRFSDDFQTPIHHDLDVLEMEEREKVVNHMWDVYTNSRRIRIPRFWQEAFEAAYEDLTSDIAEVREAAISEIAKMSMHSIHLDPAPLRAKSARHSSLKQAEEKEGRNDNTL